MNKPQINQILSTEKWFTAEEAVQNGLADRIETFEEFKDRVFSKAKVTEIKIDEVDDFDFNSMELTNRRWSGI